MISLDPLGTFNAPPKADDFVPANDIAKSEIVSSLVRMSRKAHLDYDEFIYVCQEARRKLGLHRPKRQRKLPQLLSETDLKRFFRAIQDCGNVEHEIMLKFLFFTSIRVSELVNIKVSDVDLGSCKVFIDQGKGQKCAAPHFCPYVAFPLMWRWTPNRLVIRQLGKS